MLFLAAGGESFALLLTYQIILHAVLAVVVAFAVVDFRRHMRELKTRAGRCGHCGYNLRATPDGCCPECGRG